MPPADQGASAANGRYQLIPRVLCFVTSGEDVLLITGAPTKKLWAGKLNGLGGHVERGEGVQAAAEREILEEAGLRVTDLRLRGVICVDSGDEAGVGVFVFTGRALTRETIASAEGALEWVPWRQVAERDTVEDLPAILSRLAAQPASAPPFSATYRYDDAGRLLVAFDD